MGHETLYGLRGQLARDGCPDSQLVIAKDLLKDQAGEFSIIPKILNPFNMFLSVFMNDIQIFR